MNELQDCYRTPSGGPRSNLTCDRKYKRSRSDFANLTIKKVLKLGTHEKANNETFGSKLGVRYDEKTPRKKKYINEKFNQICLTAQEPICSGFILPLEVCEQMTYM